MLVIILVAGTSEYVLAAEQQPAAILRYQHLVGTQGMDLKTLSQCGVTLLSQAPPCGEDAEAAKRFVEEAHALGIKLLPYVSPEKSWYLDTPERLKNFIRANPGNNVPYYRAVDPSSHPKWILIDEMGRPSPRYGSYVQNELGESVITWTRWSSNDFKEVPNNRNTFTWYMCSSAEGYIDAVERGVRAVMDLGVDGVFVDNIYNGRLSFCHGDKLGEHKHRNPDRNTDKTYPEIVERIYKTVKSYGSDKIVQLNSGSQDTYAPFRDAAMIESYIGTHGRKGRLHDWKAVLRFAQRFADEPSHGRVVTALSYLGSSGYPPKDDCFYAYACAQLSGFKWSGHSPRMDVVRLLYRARLIAPVGKMIESDPAWYRQYDRGVVVVNPVQDREVAVVVPLPAGLNDPVDLYSGQMLKVSHGQVELSVPAESGRVIVAKKNAIDNYLVECATTLREAAVSLDVASEQELVHLPALSGTNWRELARAGKTIAEELLPLGVSRQTVAVADQDGPICDCLAKIERLLRVLPRGDSKRVVWLGAAAQYAAAAASLMRTD
jgi:hypothetical protein